MGKLRVVSWNCQWGLEYRDSQGKKDAVKRLLSEADILILQEFTEKDFKSLGHPGDRSDWYGDDQDADGKEPLGVAVFAKEGFAVERLYKGEAQFRYVLPYKISRSSDGETLMLFAVWTKKKPLGYDETLFEALGHYKPSNSNTIVIGDFNTFAKDDKGLKLLEDKMLPLVNCAKETPLTPTYHHTKDNVGVDDFCFASANLAANAKLKVCDDDKEQKLSDHYPIVVDFS
jgi:endonuclease/exonuclease/phosphatase family metal-dependent hydrolase